MAWRDFLWVFLGGGLGSVCRFGIGLMSKSWFPNALWPLGTFCVNMLGCFLIGVCLSAAEKHPALKPQLVFFLSTGFCGGFTTFSSFAHESNGLLSQEHQGLMILYMGVSFALGLFFNQMGMLLVKKLPI